MRYSQYCPSNGHGFLIREVIRDFTDKLQEGHLCHKITASCREIESGVCPGVKRTSRDSASVGFLGFMVRKANRWTGCEDAEQF